MTSEVPSTPDPEADAERRFGGLRRLYGNAGYARIRALRIAIVGVGGVGSWAAEALARSGVAALTLIDLDHVSESNINRQVQALGATLGQAKVLALRERIADIHPGCAVSCVEEFADEDNWPGLLPAEVDGVIDACDQVRAKATLAAWALASRSFRWEGFRNAGDTGNHLVGAVLMGVGGVAAMGCTVGQGLSGISTLSEPALWR